jgi:hypothetical protein
MKPYTNITIITFIMIITVILSTQTAFAQSTPLQLIKISPVILKLNLDPGKTTDYPVTVENLTNLPLPVQINVEGFNPDDEDFGYTPSGPSTQSPLTQWIKIDQSDLLLSPKTAQQMTIHITTPSQVPFGGYFAMIYFQPLLASTDIPINAKVGLLALANIGVQDENAQKARIETFDFQKSVFEDNPIQATLRVKNISLNFFTAKPKLTIKPLFGPETEYPLEEKTILPDKIRRWQLNLNLNKPLVGIYFAKMSVSTGGGDEVILNKQFYAFPLTLALKVITAVLLILIFRKRVKKALKLFIKG